MQWEGDGIYGTANEFTSHTETEVAQSLFMVLCSRTV